MKLGSLLRLLEMPALPAEGQQERWAAPGCEATLDRIADGTLSFEVRETVEGVWESVMREDVRLSGENLVFGDPAAGPARVLFFVEAVGGIRRMAEYPAMELAA